jgi:hypothetical protein
MLWRVCSGSRPASPPWIDFWPPSLPVYSIVGPRRTRTANMKLLLTSGGVSNASIRGALEGLLDKPFGECSALCIPTAEYGHPLCTPASAWRFVSGKSPSPMSDLGWKSVGLLARTLKTNPPESSRSRPAENGSEPDACLSTIERLAPIGRLTDMKTAPGPVRASRTDRRSDRPRP